MNKVIKWLSNIRCGFCYKGYRFHDTYAMCPCGMDAYHYSDALKDMAKEKQ